MTILYAYYKAQVFAEEKMNETPIDSKNNVRVTKFYAILSLVAIVIFAYSIISGVFDDTLSRLKNVAQTVGSFPQSSTSGGATTLAIAPKIYINGSIVDIASGNTTVKLETYAKDVKFYIAQNSNTTNLLFTEILGEAIQLVSPTYYNVKVFDSKKYDNGSFVIKATYINPNGVITESSHTSIRIYNEKAVVAVDTPILFDVNKDYVKTEYQMSVAGVDMSTTPLKGNVVFRSGAPDNAIDIVFVFVKADNTATKIINKSIGIVKNLDSSLWEYQVDTVNYLTDGAYKIRSAYLVPGSDWLSTNEFKFEIKNNVIDITVNNPPAFSYSNISKYLLNDGITPKILNLITNSEITSSISGDVKLSIDVDSESVYFLMGNDSVWLTNGIFGISNGVVRDPGSNIWSYKLNTKLFNNATYKLSVAYYDKITGWRIAKSKTGVVIKNVTSQEIIDQNVADAKLAEQERLAAQARLAEQERLAAQARLAEQERLAAQARLAEQERLAAQARLAEQERLTAQNSLAEQIKPSVYQPINTTTADNAIAANSNQDTTEMRLVVNNTPITNLKHTFDSELLEIRVSTPPAKSVKFHKYSTSLKPVQSTIGDGVRDEDLSKVDRDVWVRTIDLREYPTGKFIFTATSFGRDGKTRDVAGREAIVSHFMQMPSAEFDDSNKEGVITNETRQSILERVTDPSGCQNRQECEVFCSSNSVAEGKCLSFVRVKNIEEASSTIAEVKKNKSDAITVINSLIPELTKRILDIQRINIDSASSSNATNTPTDNPTILIAPESSGRSSIMDIIPKSIIESLVTIKDKGDISFPNEIKLPADMQQYCGVIEHEADCTKSIIKIAPELKSYIERQAEVVRSEENKSLQLLELRGGARSYIDTDWDGVSDFDEINFYGTNPSKKDSNGDGYSDGASLLGQVSPVVLGTSTNVISNKIVLSQGVSVENPKITGSTQDKLFSVTSIIALDYTEGEDGKKDVSKVAFKGVALPNSFVKIFLFSDPIVVTVKTDDNGNWSYILDKTLPDGTHTAYVAMADGGGRILAKSAPLPFVKEASAITVNGGGASGPLDGQNTIMGLSPITLIALFVGLLGLALSVVGVVIGIKFNDHNKPDVTLSV